jgi:hypothetical protein
MDDGLKGYIASGIASPGYGYGVSFYLAAWPLVETPLRSFQIGLPSTWIVPDNADYKGPRCPKGTVARDNWPVKDGYFHLQTLFTEKDGLCLAGPKADPAAERMGAAFMAKSADSDAQL